MAIARGNDRQEMIRRLRSAPRIRTGANVKYSNAWGRLREARLDPALPVGTGWRIDIHGERHQALPDAPRVLVTDSTGARAQYRVYLVDGEVVLVSVRGKAACGSGDPLGRGDAAGREAARRLQALVPVSLV